MNTNTYQSSVANPYAPPQSDVLVPTDDQIKYNGKLLLVTHPAVLPKFCIKCGKPCDSKQKTKKLSWVNPWWYLSFLLLGIFFIIIYLLTAKRLTVSYSLCSEHQAKERKKNIIMWSGFSLSALLIVLGSIFTDQNQTIGGLLLAAGLIIFSLFLLAALFIPRVIIIRKAKYSKQLTSKRPYVFFLNGINKSFVDATKIKH
jgi:hypothetical protein